MNYIFANTDFCALSYIFSPEDSCFGSFFGSFISLTLFFPTGVLFLRDAGGFLQLIVFRKRPVLQYKGKYYLRPC